MLITRQAPSSFEIEGGGEEGGRGCEESGEGGERHCEGGWRLAQGEQERLTGRGLEKRGGGYQQGVGERQSGGTEFPPAQNAKAGHGGKHCYDGHCGACEMAAGAEFGDGGKEKIDGVPGGQRHPNRGGGAEQIENQDIHGPMRLSAPRLAGDRIRDVRQGLFIAWAGLVSTLPAVAASHFLTHYLDVGSQPQARLLAADGAGNLFVVAMVTEPSGRPQIRVIKTDPQGNAVAQMDFGGSLVPSPDIARGAAVDPEGNVVIVGTTASPDFPLVSPLISRTTSSAAFVVKVDSQLQRILFSTRLGGTKGGGPQKGETSASAVAVDSAGAIYVTGSTTTSDFPLTPDAFQTTPPHSDVFGTATYAFVTEISSAGDRIVYSSYFGADNANCIGGSRCLGVYGYTSGAAIAVEASGKIAFAGNTTAVNLPVTPGTLGQQCNCNNTVQAGFAASLAPGTTGSNWVTYVPLAQAGIPYESNITIAAMGLDSQGDVIVGGSTPPGFGVTAGALQTTYPGGNSVPTPRYAGFIAKLDPSASRYLFSTYLGGNVPMESGDLNGVTSIAVDAQGIVWATGGSLPSELPLPEGVPALGLNYVAGLSADGSSLVSVFTAPTGAAGQAIAASSQGTVAVLGVAGSLLNVSSGPGPSLAGVTNSAGFEVSGQVAPFELVSLYGIDIGPSSPMSGQVVNGAVTTALGGVQVLFNGIAAPLLYVGPTQINAVVPGGVFGRDTVTMQIVSPGGTIGGVELFIVPSQPGVFARGDGSAIALNQDGGLNGASNPAALGSVVTVWGTGAGTANGMFTDGEIVGTQLYLPLVPVAVLANSLSLEVLYAGDAPGMVAGTIQVNFRLPEQIPPGPGSVTCALQVGTAVSQYFGIYVKQ